MAATPPGGDPAPPAGPPYPPPVTGQRVYDYADALDPETEQQAQATAEAIERRTGAQIVVYTQVKPDATTEGTEQDAVRLIDQWGIGRKGFDDGLVIFYNLDESLIHGQVQLYAAPGFRATFLTNDERQAIFDERDGAAAPSRRPRRRDARRPGGDRSGRHTRERAAPPDRAPDRRADRPARGAPLAFLLLFGWAAFSWLRFGRDPEYIDDPSIYAAGPPEELTPALASMILEGYPRRRALTSAVLDLASRGEFVFKEEPDSDVRQGRDPARRPGRRPDAGDQPPAADRQARAHDPRGDPDARRLADDDRYIRPVKLRTLGEVVGTFNDRVEASVVDKGWFTDRPRRVRNRWLEAWRSWRSCSGSWPSRPRRSCRAAG